MDGVAAKVSEAGGRSALFTTVQIEYSDFRNNLFTNYFLDSRYTGTRTSLIFAEKQDLKHGKEYIRVLQPDHMLFFRVTALDFVGMRSDTR